jgi:hypothetical protein
MGRMIKQIVEIEDLTTLESLIEQLVAIRCILPPDTQPEVSMKGDDNFGYLLSISYFRPQTAEEAECDARYDEEIRQSHASSG